MTEKTSLFSISCATCAARLTVRDEAAIGQVLACPRCGSMVMIEAPEGWIAPSAAPAPPRRPRNPNDSQATLSGEFTGLDGNEGAPRSVSIKQAARTRSTPSKGVETVQQPGSRPVKTAGGPILPDAQWDSASSRQRSKTAALIVGLSLLCLIAVGVIIWFLSGLGSSTPGEQSAKSGDPEPPSAIGKDSPPPDKDAPDDQPPDDQPLDEQPPEAGEAGTGPDDGKEANDNAGNTTDSPVEDSGEHPDPDNGANSPPETTDPAAGTTGDTDQPPVPDNPLSDIDPGKNGPLEAPPSIDGTVTQSTMLDDVGALIDLVTDPGVDLDPVGSNYTRMGFGKVFVPYPRPLEIDFERQLNEKYPGVSYEEKTLAEFARGLNALTQIPIQLDSHSIIYGQLDPSARVSFKGTDSTVVEMIDQAVKDLDLVAAVDTQSRVVVIVSRDKDVVATRTLEMNPLLAGDEAQTSELIGAIQRVTGPNLWSAFGGTAQIGISGTTVTLECDGRLADEVRTVLEQLGAAARVHSNPDDEAALESLKGFHYRTREVLDAETTIDYQQIEPVQLVLNQLADRDGLAVVVDWRSLMPEGWNPQLEVPWPGKGQSVGRTLGDIVGSMGLGWRFLGDGVVEVTTREVRWGESRVAVYPCDAVLKKRTLEQMMGVLQGKLAGELPEKSWSRVDFLPRFNCLLVRLPDPLHLSVEAILEELAR